MTVEELINKLKEYPSYIDVKVNLDGVESTTYNGLTDTNPNVIDIKETNTSGVRGVDIIVK